MKLHRTAPVVTGVAVALTGLLSGGILTASAHDGPKASSSHVATHGDSIPNVTVVENQIKAYYGDTVNAEDGLHYPSSTGNYANEMAHITAAAKGYLKGQASRKHSGKPALVFDVDDTTLNTYNYEISSTFAYNPTTNADFVNNAKFPAVFGMPALVNWANDNGYTVFFLTGRPVTQRDGTVANLAKVGYTASADVDHLYLKDKVNPPAYLPCGAACTTTEYKSGTRKHIESLGYDIVANFGDQWSDLNGGYADKTFKVPNPMYYRP
ncbi:MAG: HAD family acid phosphatase [Oryzihumus sp.]